MGLKLGVLLLLLAVQIPVRMVVTHFERNGRLPPGIAAFINDAIPLGCLFWLINFMNALPEPAKRDDK